MTLKKCWRCPVRDERQPLDALMWTNWYESRPVILRCRATVTIPGWEALASKLDLDLVRLQRQIRDRVGNQNRLSMENADLSLGIDHQEYLLVLRNLQQQLKMAVFSDSSPLPRTSRQQP